jgi:predicted alpha/beta superfamily hydrolase
LSSVNDNNNIGSITLQCVYPDSRVGSGFLAVRGNGFGLNWNDGVTMTRVSANTYSTTRTTTNTGQFRWKCLLNDVTWAVGSDELVSVTSTSTSGTVVAYPWFGTQSGRLVYDHGIRSPQLDNTRSLSTYLPPSYDENTLKRYPVLYAHDGNNMFVRDSNCMDCCPFGCWGAHTTLNSNIIGGNMTEIILVGVYNTPQRMDEYTYIPDPGYGGGDGDLYLDFLEETLVPFVVGKYRVDANEPLAQLGSSLGGLISSYAGWSRPNVWEKTGSLSSSFWWNNEHFLDHILESFVPTQTYIDSGSPGDSYAETIRVRDRMIQLGKVLNLTI